MGNSIEKPEKLQIVFGDMAYDAEKETIECPPKTVNNRKMLPKYRVPMQEGEITINLVSTRFDKENGKIVSYEDYVDNKDKEEEIRA